MNNEVPNLAPEEIEPVTGLTYAELAREHRRRAAVAAANADPLPGPLALAFPAQPIRVGALAVRPVVGIDFVILRHLDSPLLKQMAEARKPVEERQPTTFTDEDGWDMALQFLLPPEEAEALVRRGPEVFRREARQRIGLAMNPVIINQIAAAVGEQFARSFTTAVEFGAAASEAATPFFITPPDAKTASAGGSNTSPPSCGASHK